jgi:predicted naringenin-chalcone synthase
MAQKKKTPKHLLDLLQRHEHSVQWTNEVLAAKQLPLENQAELVQKHSSEYWIARQVGFNEAIEHALLSYGCYAGFAYLAARPKFIEGTTEKFVPTVGIDDPDFQEWRRKYFTR